MFSGVEPLSNGLRGQAMNPEDFMAGGLTADDLDLLVRGGRR